MIEKGWAGSLNSIMGWSGPITHRQVTTFCAWQILSLNYPDRNNYYQMMVACVTARANAKHPQTIQPSQFRMSFGNNTPITREERDKRSKEVMEARIASRGGLARYTIMDIHGNVLRPALKPTTSCINPLIRPPNAEEIAAFRNRRLQTASSTQQTATPISGEQDALGNGTRNTAHKTNGRRNRADSLPGSSGKSTPKDGS